MLKLRFFVLKEFNVIYFSFRRHELFMASICPKCVVNLTFCYFSLSIFILYIHSKGTLWFCNTSFSYHCIITKGDFWSCKRTQWVLVIKENNDLWKRRVMMSRKSYGWISVEYKFKFNYVPCFIIWRVDNFIIHLYFIYFKGI